MKIAQSYNKIASSYDENADAFSLLTNSRFSALRQIQSNLDEKAVRDVLDIGAGSGVFIKELHAIFNQATFTALDISRAMLDLAKERLPQVKTVEAGVTDVEARLRGQKFDLIIAHFVLAYASLEELMKQALPLLKPGGVLSVVTTTHESFPFFQSCVKEQSEKTGALGRLVKHFHKSGMQKTSTPQSYQNIQDIASQHGMAIVGRQQISTEIVFNDSKRMADFAIRGGWLLNAQLPFLPTKLFYHIARTYFNHAFEFPLRDHHIVEVVLFSLNQ